ncbi:hypothetical protein QBC43DRAFT_221042 [Cladorrhinum sp. PSN259]|nr:hypothetical protein QBC43DRAFT_221042 [Cladorrhinum sp. PSN259]
MARRAFSTVLAPILLSGIVRAATTNGPLAGVTIYAETAWSTARRCAAGCIKYKGDLPCNVVGYYDVGVFLGCGRCDQINACYCSAGLGSSATSYLSSCVSNGCKGVDTWEDELTSMLGIYNNYCATANVAPTSTSRKPLTVTTNTPAAQQTTGTVTTPADKGAEEKDGLSKSDIVALAASLGVGIPSLAIAGLTLWIQLRKRKEKEGEAALTAASGSGHTSPEVQQAQVTGPGDGYQYGGRPHIQELGESRGYGRY